MENAEISVLHDGSAWWSELPKNLKKNVLAWLPAEMLCRYCGVCKEWNALFSHKQFITKDWLSAPPNKKPWLLLFHYLDPLDCLAYCFFTGTWKRLSLAFLRKQYDVHSFSMRASAAGLFLATIHFKLNTGSSLLTHIVCNPLTGKSIKLPWTNHGLITAMAMTMIAEKGDGHNDDTYKVVAMIMSLDIESDIVDIYDSSLKSWSTVGRLPENFNPVTTGRIVASRDFLYVNGKDANSSKSGILAFSIQNGRSVFTPLPLEEVDDRKRCDVLFTCGSRVLLGSWISDLGVIIISEFENSNSSMVGLTDIARMHLSMLDSHKRDAIFSYGILMPDFEGMRDLVFIRFGRGNEVLVYNLSQDTWTWLCRCPMPSLMEDWYVFEPRPDKDVE